MKTVSAKRMPKTNPCALDGNMLLSLLLLATFCFLSTGAEDPEYRPLPNDGVVPQKYHIQLLPWMETKDWLLQGATTIEIMATSTTRSVTFHTQHPIQRAVVSHAESGVEVPILEIFYDIDPTLQVALVFSSSLEPGSYVIYMEHNYTMTEESVVGEGFFKREYIEDGVVNYLAATQLENLGARRVFPCFDQPNLKARFQLTIGHRTEATVIRTNTPAIASVPMDGEEGWVWSTFQETEKMSTYLVAIAIGNFVENSTESDVPFSVLTPPSRIQEASIALESGAHILKYFESFWNSTYTFPKMDMIPIEDHPAGAMENWGLILFSPPLFYYNEGVDLIAVGKQVIEVTSHELAHQWFGNLVTFDWWSQWWLNEGFAAFYQFWGADDFDFFGKWLQRLPIVGVQPGYEADKFIDALPVAQEIYDETFEFADSALIYRKGAALNRMMLSILQDAYFKGIEVYIRTFAYQNTRNDDFWNVMQATADASGITLPASLRDIMNTFFLQPGVPLVSVTRDYVGNIETVNLQQERYLISGQDDGRLYYIPLKYTVPALEGSSSSITWFSKQTDTLELRFESADDWLLVNPERESYMIVLYDDENYNRIAEQLNLNHMEFSAVARGVIFTDLYFAVQKGLVSAEIGAKMTDYLQNELDEIAWFGMLKLHDVLRTNPPSSTYEEDFRLNAEAALNNAYDANQLDPGYFDVVIELLEGFLQTGKDRTDFYDSRLWKIINGDEILSFLTKQLNAKIPLREN